MNTVNYVVICNSNSYCISGENVDRIMDRVAQTLENCRKYWRYNDVFLLQFIKQLTSDEKNWSLNIMKDKEFIPKSDHKIPVINMDTLMVELHSQLESINSFGFSVTSSAIFEMDFETFITKFKKNNAKTEQVSTKQEKSENRCCNNKWPSDFLSYKSNTYESSFSSRLEAIERKLGLR